MAQRAIRLRDTIYENREAQLLEDPSFFAGLGNYEGQSFLMGERRIFGIGSVYATIMQRANSCGPTKLTAFYDRPGPKMEARGTNGWDLVNRRPNGRQLPMDWKSEKSMHFDLYNESFNQIWKNPETGVLGLYPIHPARVLQVRLDEETGTKVFYLNTKQGFITMTEEAGEIIHFVRNPSTMDPVGPFALRGMNPVRYAQATFELGVDLETYIVSLQKNQHHVGMVLEHPATFRDKKTLARLRESFREYQGSENAGKILITEEGMRVSANTGAIDMQQAQFIESCHFNAGILAAIFDWPIAALNQGIPGAPLAYQTPQLNQLERQARLHSTYKCIEEGLNGCEALQKNQKANLIFEFERLSSVMVDKTDHVDLILSELSAGLLTKNEAREALGRPPLPGGDTLAEPAPIVVNPAPAPAVKGPLAAKDTAS